MIKFTSDRSVVGVLDTILCDKVYLRQVTWFSTGTSTNKTDRHDIIEILLKVALSTITLTPTFMSIISTINGLFKLF